MATKIFIAEFADEFESFLHYCRENNIDFKSFKIIALDAPLQVYLKKKKICFENTLKYFNSESHIQCLLKSEELYKLNRILPEKPASTLPNDTINPKLPYLDFNHYEATKFSGKLTISSVNMLHRVCALSTIKFSP